MIEANLGIICACLIVLKQLVKHFLLSMFSPPYRVSGGPASANTKREPPAFEKRQQQHFKLDETVDDEDVGAGGSVYGHRNNGKGVGPAGTSYQMASLAYSDGRRNSDEKHIMSPRVRERDPSQSSVENEDIVTVWPLDRRPDVMKNVPSQLSSRPSSPVGR